MRIGRDWAKAVAGLALGAGAAVAELAFLLAAAVGAAYSLLFSRRRRALPRAVGAGAALLAEADRRRLRRWYGQDHPPGDDALRALAYLVLRAPLGLLGGAILLLIAQGAVTGATAAAVWLAGGRIDGIAFSWPIALYGAAAGTVLLFLAVQGLAGVVVLEGRLARRCFGPDPLAAYQRRIAELSVSRAEVVQAVDDERRRIERDLHDGVQQRLVGLAMLIGRARRAGEPDRAAELMRHAQDEAQHALDDLREVAWRIYPAALDEAGLAAALDTVAERSAVPVRIEYGPVGRLPGPVQTVAYFVVCEAVTNAAKHSGAGQVAVRVAGRGSMLVVSIEDDGAGGADPAGGGLSGLRRRVAALDGRLAVRSPAGGPTTVTAELPCG